MTFEEREQLRTKRKLNKGKKIILDDFLNTTHFMAIHCSNNEQAKILFMAFKKAGACWRNGEMYNTHDTRFTKNTWYTNKGTTIQTMFVGLAREVFEFEEVELDKYIKIEELEC